MNHSSPRIITVPILPMGMLNSYIIVGERSILVDTGMPGGADKILAAMAREGISKGDISLILITHRHVDHIGDAAALQRVTGAPVAVHALDAEWLRRGEGGPRPPTGWAGRLFDLTGLPAAHATPCEPDLILEEEFSLAPYGVPDAMVLHTPGHTAGSVSALLADGRALAGDLVSGGVFIGGIAMRGRATKPPYEDEPKEVRESLLRLLSRGAGPFYVGHGGPLTAAAVRKYLSREPRLACANDKQAGVKDFPS